MNYEVIKGDLIALAKQGKFDVIVHGCNCFSTQKSGIAKQMVEAFRTNTFGTEIEKVVLPYNINRLGQIDWMVRTIAYGPDEYSITHKDLTVVNCYTQYGFGTDKVQIDYEALRLCLRKINHMFADLHIGLPQIGSGLAGGDWNAIEKIIQNELKSMKVTVVIYEK